MNIEHKNNVEDKKSDAIEAYCVKCRSKVEVKNPEDMKMKNERLAIRGTCPICGTKVFRIK